MHFELVSFFLPTPEFKQAFNQYTITLGSSVNSIFSQLKNCISLRSFRINLLDGKLFFCKV